MCSVLTLSQTLMSLEKSGLVGKQGDCTSLGWFDLMALPDVHMKPAVPAPGESVGVYVLWLLASKMHNLI